MILAWRNKPELKAILAWHNKPELKAEALAGMIRHRQQDDFIRGNYLARRMDLPEVLPEGASAYQGCFHGCLTTDKLAQEAGVTVEEFIKKGFDLQFTSWHAEAQRLWGIPTHLGNVLDYMFETQPDALCAAFAVDTIEAMEVGADLDGVELAWVHMITTDPIYGDPAGMKELLESVNIGAGQAEALADDYAERVSPYQDDTHAYWEAQEDWHIWAAQKLIEAIREAPIPAAKGA